jgi:two-component system, CAI-1 autoinducer sensor kinase/phosphatase CqsS
MTKSALRSFVMRHPILLRIREEIFDPEIETILNPSPSRFYVLGFFTLIGQLGFWYIWAVWVPQPYENALVRVCIALLGVGFFYKQPQQDSLGAWARRYFSIVFWLQLPVFFTWMYWMNGANSVWLASTAAMIFIYYQFTDWRLACIGLICGAGIATLVAYLQLGSLVTIPAAHIIVLSFSLFAAISLATSAANLRRERIQHSLVVIGIMAHELRTPLATLSLIGQAIRTETENDSKTERIKGITKLTKRLEILARVINHHIDLQMINARFMQLPRVNQLISATGLINFAVKEYPFSSQKEQDCIEVIVYEDFWFYGSERQFLQVINNLLKNALYSLKAAQSRLSPGDIRIELGKKSNTGKITVTDQGVGISADDLHRIFEPFFSTSNDTGHGLGLAYCRQVVQSAGGFIRVKSKPALGAIFTIDLPAQIITPTENRNHAISSVPPP